MAISAGTKRVEVVLVDLPEVLSDIVVAILERDPQVRIVAQLRSEQSALPAIVGAWIDVAIVGGDGEPFVEAVHELLCRRPRLRTLTVSEDGQDASLYELRPHRTSLGELSPDTLLEAVKADSGEGCGRARRSA